MTARSTQIYPYRTILRPHELRAWERRVRWPSAVTDEPINTGDAKTPLFAFGYGRSPY